LAVSGAISMESKSTSGKHARTTALPIPGAITNA
jgi:hypothetical protein